MRWQFGEEDRQALALTSSSRLEWDVAHVPGDGLSLVLGAPDLGLRVVDGIVTPGTRSDGCRVHLDVVRGDTAHRAWSLPLQPGEGWREAIVDLSDWLTNER